ncbi:MAG TPA: hypothetical protein VMU94_10975 [Streptosporangiaceae bacterium]|nr:hypothetical protein [Streptosporangiaceae bacterium]
MLSSAWPQRIIAFNRHAFPGRTPGHYAGLRHFFIGCHDTSGEFLAQDLTVEVTDGNFGAALREAVNRTCGTLDDWREFLRRGPAMPGNRAAPAANGHGVPAAAGGRRAPVTYGIRHHVQRSEPTADYALLANMVRRQSVASRST